MTDSTKPRSNRNAVLTIIIIVVAIGATWRGCWDATPLSDEALTEYLAADRPENEIQRALYQIKERAENGDEDVARFFPLITALADHPTPQIRSTVAWTMGGARWHEEFKAPLTALVEDDEIFVRYNAALGLARRNEASVRPILLAMLESYRVVSPADGTLALSIGLRDTVRFRATLARIRKSDGSTEDVNAPLDGRVARLIVTKGETLAKGDPILEIGATDDRMSNALAALNIVGTKDDAPAVQRLADAAGSSALITRLAAETARALQSR